MSEFTVVLSLGPDQRAERTTFQDGLRSRLKDAEWPHVILPDLYHLVNKDSVAALASLSDPLVVLSWHKPRAMYWILQQLGVAGHRASSIQEERPGSRPIVCLDLSKKCCPGGWHDALKAMGARPAADADSGLREIQAETASRWYPIIDYDRCTGCGECLEFCLFGVYDTDAEGRVVASSPGLCKPGCPACSRVCPSAAIVFPEFKGDDVIAGADEGTILPFRPGDIARVRAACSQGKLTEDDVIRACACQPGETSPSESKAEARAASSEDLDAILDRTVGE